MHRLPVWVCGLMLLGCQARHEPQAQRYVELQVGTVTSRVSVVQGAWPPTTLAYTTDSADQTRHASKTEHDCNARTSTLKYLAVLDEKMTLLREAELDIELDIEAGSLGEAELILACGPQANIKGMV